MVTHSSRLGTCAVRENRVIATIAPEPSSISSMRMISTGADKLIMILIPKGAGARRRGSKTFGLLIASIRLRSLSIRLPLISRAVLWLTECE